MVRFLLAKVEYSLRPPISAPMASKSLRFRSIVAPETLLHGSARLPARARSAQVGTP